MSRTFALSFFIFTLSFACVWFFILRAPQQEIGNGKIHIVASFYPLAHIAEMVGGDFVSVQTLVPAGAEPHDFEPSPRDFVEIGKADILLYNGAGFEPWVKKWETSGTLRTASVIDMAKALAGRHVSLVDRGGRPDPHFWLNPIIYVKETEIVRDALASIDPAHRDLFAERATRFISTLENLGQRFQKDLAVCAIRDIVVSHDAFGYLAAQYGFNTTSIAGISPEEEPAPKELARIAEVAREKNVRYIFSETVASPKFSELIAREIGASVLVLNPIESLTPNEVQLGDDYVSKMEINLSNLRKAMVCN